MNNPAAKMPKLLEKRPEPPELEHILEDLEKSKPDDCAFNFFTTSTKQHEGDLHKTGENLTGSERSSSRRPKQQKTEDQSEVISETEACYKKVTDLMQSYQYLKESQSSLGERCSELEEIGLRVQEQISELKMHLQSQS